jgi:hypothetical protein
MIRKETVQRREHFSAGSRKFFSWYSVIAIKALLSPAQKALMPIFRQLFLYPHKPFLDNLHKQRNKPRAPESFTPEIRIST